MIPPTGYNSLKSYKAIFLDWDDTIGDFHNAELQALKDIYLDYDLHRLYATFEEYYAVYHPYNLELWDKYGRSEVTKEELEFQRFYFPMRLLTDAHKTAPRMAKDFLRLTTHYFSLLPDSEEVVRYLANRYPLTIVSNGFVEVQYEKVRRSGLQDCFRHIVLSEEVGWQKPNPLIFREALSRNGLEAEEVLMIGDSYSSDIQGARNAGIDQLWITAESPDAARPVTYRVSCLRDVMGFL